MINITANEENLCELLKTKSTQAFSQLYDKYSGALYGIICKMVQDVDVTQVLLQDVFVRIWKNVDSFDESKETLFTWMLHMTLDTCSDYTRTLSQQQLTNDNK